MDMQATLDIATGTALTQVMDQAEDMMIELGVHDTIKALQDLPATVAGAQAATNASKIAIDSHKANGLTVARERYDMAMLAATMEAPQDGKNAEARAVQLKAFLAGPGGASVRQAENALHSQETELRRLEAILAGAEADLDLALNRLRATLAIAGLQEAVLKATAVRL